MNIFIFDDADGDRVIVHAPTAEDAKRILINEFDRSNFAGKPFANAFTGTPGLGDGDFAGGTVEVPIDDVLNVWTHKKSITPGDTLQYGVLYEFD